MSGAQICCPICLMSSTATHTEIWLMLCVSVSSVSSYFPLILNVWLSFLLLCFTESFLGSGWLCHTMAPRLASYLCLSFYCMCFHVCVLGTYVWVYSIVAGSRLLAHVTPLLRHLPWLFSLSYCSALCSLLYEVLMCKHMLCCSLFLFAATTASKSSQCTCLKCGRRGWRGWSKQTSKWRRCQEPHSAPVSFHAFASLPFCWSRHVYLTACYSLRAFLLSIPHLRSNTILLVS